MAEPYVGEIRLVSFNYPPRGWAFCRGQLLSINQNQALFFILGNAYGGDGRVTFALPNFQARAPMHPGAGSSVGTQRGSASAQLRSVPAHGHPAGASAAAASLGDPRGALLAAAQNYGTAGTGAPVVFHETLPAGGDPSGSGEAARHPNLQPYLGLHFVIALTGIFPSE